VGPQEQVDRSPQQLRLELAVQALLDGVAMQLRTRGAQRGDQRARALVVLVFESSHEPPALGRTGGELERTLRAARIRAAPHARIESRRQRRAEPVDDRIAPRDPAQRLGVVAVGMGEHHRQLARLGRGEQRAERRAGHATAIAGPRVEHPRRPARTAQHDARAMPDIECVDDPAVRARRPRQEQQAPQGESDPRHAPAGTGAQPAERHERRGESQQDEWPGR